ncbi:MAB_1171c family putative transporter [Streptomyces sp. NPDC048551]|uniref:MAB_1171c family putative transporter n=1 Tax=Streptomyces sp. NPDC048551 TaxID=3155758 RepID=UPI00341D8E8F
MRDMYYYLPAAVLLVAFALRLPGFVRHWHDPLVRSVAVVLPLGAVVFFFAAPATISRVNQFTGVTNFSAPLVYIILTAGSAGLINLTIMWRGGPEERRRAATRWCVGVYGAVIAALVTLFALGHAPDERLRDFDTYYATAAYLREMIVLYLLAHALATLVLAVLCWRWAREVAGLLRVGLLLIVTGSLFSLGYAVLKLVAVGARWSGLDWDWTSTTVAPTLASLATLCQCVGFALPSVSQALARGWRQWTQYRRLGPLWRTARAITPYELVPIPWWSSLSRRHLRRVCDIRDGLRLLSPYLDRDGATGAAAFVTGPGALKPEAERHAALVIAAFRSAPGPVSRPAPGPVSGPVSGPVPEALSAAGGGGLEGLLEGADEELVRLSDALRAMTAPPARTGPPEPVQAPPRPALRTQIPAPCDLCDAGAPCDSRTPHVLPRTLPRAAPRARPAETAPADGRAT